MRGSGGVERNPTEIFEIEKTGVLVTVKSGPKF